MCEYTEECEWDEAELCCAGCEAYQCPGCSVDGRIAECDDFERISEHSLLCKECTIEGAPRTRDCSGCDSEMWVWCCSKCTAADAVANITKQ
jgi:hypothetical protein